MSLQIIYGTVGTGKSSYVFEQVQEKIKENTTHQIKIITPEQFSFTAEKKLLETSPSNSILKAEVITFARMAYRILNEVGGKTRKHLSSSGRAMLIDHILLTQKNDFAFLGKTDENVEMIGRQLTELKKHQVSVEKLKEVCDETKNKYLQTKLKDITNLYELYTNQIETQYLDENDNLNLLAEKLESSKEFYNCDIYIDEFAGFTLQEYEILRKLMKISHKVTITICADNLNENTNPDIDIFYANKQTANRILNIAREEQIEIEEPIRLLEEKRFKTGELAYLVKSMREPYYKPYQDKIENISLFLANNPYSEIEEVAIQITKLAKQGYRYEDIAVITKDITTYSSLAKAIFNKYQIPVFIDEKKDLSSNLLVKLVLSLLEIFAKNWSYEAMFGLIKTGFFELDNYDISLLENYCIKWGIKGSKWYAKEWKFYDETDEEKQKILYAKEKIVSPLLKFKNNLAGYKTVKEITRGIYEFLKENNIEQKLNEKVQYLKETNNLEIAKEYETSLKILIDLLDEIVLVLGEKVVTFERYSKILKMGFSQSDLGTIPATADQVVIGDIDRSRTHKVRVAFLIGLNDGSFPQAIKDEGFLDDEDRRTLKEQGIELAKTTLEQLYDDNFNIYKAFGTAEEKLFLSYLSSDSDGGSLRPSILVNKIKRIFPNLKETSDVVKRESSILLDNTTFDELLVKLREYKNGEEIEPIWFEVYKYYELHDKEKLESSLKALEYKNIPEKIEKSNLQKLYGDTLKTSVSRLEKYRACPFSYYLNYGLKLKEKRDFKIESFDTGSFMHEVIDRFFEVLEERNISVKSLEKEEAKKITEEVIEEKLALKQYEIFNSIPKYRAVARRLSRAITQSMWYIVEGLKYSEFELVGHEVEFGEGKEYLPIIFELEDGKKVEIVGKIDRIDIAKMPDGSYIRIIDYKSTPHNINLNEVRGGLQLQLLTYLDVACKNKGYMPAGALYLTLVGKNISREPEENQEIIESELRKQFKMQGLILADSNIVKKMDTNLEKTGGKSNIIDASILKSGDVGKNDRNISRKQFEDLQVYIEKTIKQISSEILNGSIPIEPYYNVQSKATGCDYCQYKAICKFNQVSQNSYRYISKDSGI